MNPLAYLLGGKLPVYLVDLVLNVQILSSKGEDDLALSAALSKMMKSKGRSFFAALYVSEGTMTMKVHQSGNLILVNTLMTISGVKLL